MGNGNDKVAQNPIYCTGAAKPGDPLVFGAYGKFSTDLEIYEADIDKAEQGGLATYPTRYSKKHFTYYLAKVDSVLRLNVSADSSQGGFTSVERAEKDDGSAVKMGFFNGMWSGGLWLEHEAGSNEVTGTLSEDLTACYDPTSKLRDRTKDVELKGRAVTKQVRSTKGGTVDVPVLELDWARDQRRTYVDATGKALLLKVDDNTLVGYWLPGYLVEDNMDWYQFWLAEPDGSLTGIHVNAPLGPYYWLVHRTTKREDLGGFEVPLKFKGYDQVVPFYVSPGQYQEEYQASIHREKTTELRTVLLEFGYRYTLPDGTKKEADLCVRYPHAIDREAEVTLINSIIYDRAFKVGTELTEEDQVEDELKRCASIIEPRRWQSSYKNMASFQAGLKDGKKAKDDVWESLVFRMAEKGFLPGDRNPFEKDSADWLEFQAYRNVDRKLEGWERFVELYEHPRGHEQFPGRIWQLDEGPWLSVDDDDSSNDCLDFADDDFKSIRIPGAYTVKLYPSAKELSGGQLHDVSDVGEIDWVEIKRDTNLQLTKKEWNDAQGDPLRIAYRRGRQMYLVKMAEARSGDGEVPSTLWMYGETVGLSEQSIQGMFNRGYLAASTERQTSLVKAYVSLGYTKQSGNPYHPELEKKLCEEFNHFLKLLEEATPGQFDKAIKEGEIVRKINEFGTQVGHEKKSGSESTVRKWAIEANIPEKAALRMYNGARTIGQQQIWSKRAHTWFKDESNQKKLGEALGKIIAICVENDLKWSYVQETHRYGWQHKEAAAYHMRWPQLYELVEDFEDKGVPRKIFWATAYEALRKNLPEAQRQYNKNAIVKLGDFLRGIGEWTVAAAAALADTITWPIQALAAYTNFCDETYLMSKGWVNFARETYRDSVFRKINADTTVLQCYGMAFQGISEAALFWTGCGTALKMSRNLHMLRSGVFTLTNKEILTGAGQALFKKRLSHFLIGSTKWAWGEFAKVLLRNLAVSMATGAIEEGVHAAIEGRSFDVGDWAGKTGRNSLMFLGFMGAFNYMSAMKMTTHFMLLANLPQMGSIVSASCELVTALEKDNKEARDAAAKILVTEFMNWIVTAGIPGVAHLLFSPKAIRADSPTIKTVKKVAKIAIDAYKTPPRPKVQKKQSKTLYKKLKQELRNTKKMDKFFEQAHGWKGLEAALDSLPRNSLGKLTRKSQKIHKKVVFEYLKRQADIKDPKKRMEAGLKLYEEIGSWKAVKELDQFLPRNRKNQISKVGLQVYQDLAWARTQFTMRTYKKTHDHFQDQGVTINGEKMYVKLADPNSMEQVVGTAPYNKPDKGNPLGNDFKQIVNPKFKQLRSDLDFSADFGSGGTPTATINGKKRTLTIDEQEQILILAKRHHEDQIVARFPDPGKVLDTNSYIRFDSYATDSFSQKFFQTRENMIGIYALRMGTLDLPNSGKHWQRVEEAILRGARQGGTGDVKVARSQVKAALKLHEDFAHKQQQAKQDLEKQGDNKEHVDAKAMRAAVRAEEDDLLAFLKTQKDTLRQEGPEGDQARLLYVMQKQELICHYPETYASGDALSLTVFKYAVHPRDLLPKGFEIKNESAWWRDTTPQEKLAAMLTGQMKGNARINNLSYMHSKFVAYEGKSGLKKFHEGLAKYDMRVSLAGNIKSGEGKTVWDKRFKLMDSIKTAKTLDEARDLFRKFAKENKIKASPDELANRYADEVEALVYTGISNWYANRMKLADD